MLYSTQGNFDSVRAPAKHDSLLKHAYPSCTLEQVIGIFMHCETWLLQPPTSRHIKKPFLHFMYGCLSEEGNDQTCKNIQFHLQYINLCVSTPQEGGMALTVSSRSERHIISCDSLTLTSFSTCILLCGWLLHVSEFLVRIRHFQVTWREIPRWVWSGNWLTGKWWVVKSWRRNKAFGSRSGDALEGKE